MVNPYPLMFSHVKCAGDIEYPEPVLDDCYKTSNSYQYFSKEEYWYEDSNFHENPFERESFDSEEEFTFNPIKRSNSYEVLGIDEDSEEEDIKKAFREKALIHHPDKPTGNKEEFIKIREAYECLIA